MSANSIFSICLFIMSLFFCCGWFYQLRIVIAGIFRLISDPPRSIFGLPSPESYRPLPSHSLQDRLPCLFAPHHSILRVCYLLRLAKPSIGCHGASRNEEGLVFVRIFNAFMLFNVSDTSVNTLDFFD